MTRRSLPLIEALNTCGPAGVRRDATLAICRVRWRFRAGASQARANAAPGSPASAHALSHAAVAGVELSMARVATVLLPSLRSWRLRLGYTQERLATCISMRRNVIWRIEAGQPTRILTARRLAAVLGVQVADLSAGGPPAASTPAQ